MLIRNKRQKNRSTEKRRIDLRSLKAHFKPSYQEWEINYWCGSWNGKTLKSTTYLRKSFLELVHPSSINPLTKALSITFTMKNDVEKCDGDVKAFENSLSFFFIHFASTSNSQRESESLENFSLISTSFSFRYPQRKFEFFNQKTHTEREKKTHRKSFNLLSAMKQTTRCVFYEASIRLKASKFHWRNV